MITVGTDIIEIERIARSIKNRRFITRNFSLEEQVLFEQRRMSPQTIAAHFCAKEAFAKSLGTGVRGFALRDISVLRDAQGAPYLSFSEDLQKMLCGQSLHFSVSISHTRQYATAVVIAYKD